MTDSYALTVCRGARELYAHQDLGPIARVQVATREADDVRRCCVASWRGFVKPSGCCAGVCACGSLSGMAMEGSTVSEPEPSKPNAVPIEGSRVP
jgi:hypothetical protein